MVVLDKAQQEALKDNENHDLEIDQDNENDNSNTETTPPANRIASEKKCVKSCQSLLKGWGAPD